MKRIPIREPRDIPNQDGFNLLVTLKNGVQKSTTVVYSKAQQCHHLNGISFTDVRTWEPL